MLCFYWNGQLYRWHKLNTGERWGGGKKSLSENKLFEVKVFTFSIQKPYPDDIVCTLDPAILEAMYPGMDFSIIKLQIFLFLSQFEFEFLTLARKIPQCRKEFHVLHITKHLKILSRFSIISQCHSEWQLC